VRLPYGDHCVHENAPAEHKHSQHFNASSRFIIFGGLCIPAHQDDHPAGLRLHLGVKYSEETLD